MIQEPTEMHREIAQAHQRKADLPCRSSHGTGDAEKAWEEAVLDPGCERQAGFRLTQVAGEGVCRPEPGRAREGQGSRQWFGLAPK